MQLIWHRITQSDEPRDQQADLPIGPRWAEIGPDRGDTWSYAILEVTEDDDQCIVVEAIVPTEADAKAAVQAWVETSA